MLRNYELYIKDILTVINRIAQYTSKINKISFTENEMIVDSGMQRMFRFKHQIYILILICYQLMLYETI